MPIWQIPSTASIWLALQCTKNGRRCPCPSMHDFLGRPRDSICTRATDRLFLQTPRNGSPRDCEHINTDRFVVRVCSTICIQIGGELWFPIPPLSSAGECKINSFKYLNTILFTTAQFSRDEFFANSAIVMVGNMILGRVACATYSSLPM